PPGRSAGKWGEWYPDILGRDGKLTTDISKPYWQSGWLKQHDRLMGAVAAMPARIPLVKWRPSRHCRRPHASERPARFQQESHCRRLVGAAWHRRQRVAVSVPRRRGYAARTSSDGGGPEAA